MKENLKQEGIRESLEHLLSSVFHLVFLTSGQCLIYDKEGQQISELQVEFLTGESNLWLLKKIAERAERFTIGKVRHWMEDVSKDEFFAIANLNYSE